MGKQESLRSTDPPRNGRMGGVYDLIEANGGMTRLEIIEACKEHELVRGSIDRMIMYARKNNLLLGEQKQPTLFEPQPEQSEPINLPPKQPHVNGTSLTEMSPAALVFLEDPLARQLAVAWVTCSGDEAIWVANSGIRSSSHGTARQLCRALRTSGICRDGGITDALALKYISTIVASPLLKRMKEGK